LREFQPLMVVSVLFVIFSSIIAVVNNIKYSVLEDSEIHIVIHVDIKIQLYFVLRHHRHLFVTFLSTGLLQCIQTEYAEQRQEKT